MKHLTLSHGFFYNAESVDGVLYGMAYQNGSHNSFGRKATVAEAKAAAGELAAEHGLPVQEFDVQGLRAERGASEARWIARRAAEQEALKLIEVSESHSLNMRLTRWPRGPGVVVRKPAKYGRIQVSKRLAHIEDENARFVATPSRELLQMAPSEQPRYQGHVFGIIDHPEHGRIAVCLAEFNALGLPEVASDHRELIPARRSGR